MCSEHERPPNTVHPNTIPGRPRCIIVGLLLGRCTASKIEKESDDGKAGFGGALSSTPRNQGQRGGSDTLCTIFHVALAREAFKGPHCRVLGRYNYKQHTHMV